MVVGESPVMVALVERLKLIARTDFTVLIEGESGSGKELVAREIHRLSARGKGPFIPVNCAALVETLFEAELFGIEERTATGVRGRRGKFELADEGTLFLDEVADLSPTSQAKLLRVLQDLCIERVGGHGAKRVNTRVVAATNRSLASQVAAGKFRADLFYRLAGVEVHVPPLRLHREDIPSLVDHVLARHRRTRPLRANVSAMDALREFDWPGNVRQLERVIERALALTVGPVIAIGDLPAEITGAYRLEPASAVHDDSLKAWTSRYVRLILDRCDGNKRRACSVLDISYHTLQTYLGYGGPVGHAGPGGSDQSMVGSPTAGMP
jgi:transcriptional regulator with PAS, ATPase and Fis domain